MATTVPSKRDKPTNALPGQKGMIDWLRPFLGSTVGSKYLVALTGAALTGFVIVHLVGNLAIFGGRTAINEYAAFLKSRGPLLWAARLGLLAVFLLHIYVSLRLKARAAHARPTRYAYEQTAQASLASRTMLWSGLVILAFVIFHLAHYTLGLVTQVEVRPGEYVNYLELHENPQDPASRHDVYAMTYYGFQNPLVSVLYIIAQVLLIMHLSHGVQSAFQSLGANAPRLQPSLRLLGWAVALFVGGGNILIVVAVWAGLLPAPY